MPASRAADETAIPDAPPPQRKVVCVERFDRAHRLGKPNDNPADAAVADDQVRPQAEAHDGHGGIERAQEIGEVVGILGFEQPVGAATRLEPDERRQRCVGRELAPDGRHFGKVSHHRAFTAWIASARPAAVLVMSPAPRQTTKSPALTSSARRSARSSGEATAYAAW